MVLKLSIKCLENVSVTDPFLTVKVNINLNQKHHGGR